jgi:hypothetical protein
LCLPLDSDSPTTDFEHIDDDAEARRMWKRFQMVATLPERDQKAVIRLINSLVAVGRPAAERSKDLTS